MFILKIDNLTEQQKDSIATVFTMQKFKKGEFIVTEGEPASSFYVIKEVFIFKKFIICFI